MKDTNETRCFFISDGLSSASEVQFNNLTIRNGVFQGSDAGANIHNRETLTLNNCRILNGRGIGNDADGAGIYSQNAELTLIDCTVSGNQSTGNDADGAGVLTVDGSLTMTGCTVSGNQTSGGSASGGGIFTFDTVVALSRCTITNNTALNSIGGGLFMARKNHTIEHCTIVDNQANEGGGLLLSSDIVGSSNSVTLDSTVIRDNDGDDMVRRVTGGSFFIFSEGGLNLIGTGNGQENFAPKEINTDPILLLPLANYGGPTETMPPLPNSPVIDAATGSTATTDQRDISIVATPDIGAVEFLPVKAQLTLIDNRLVISEINGPVANQLEISAVNGDFQISDTGGLILDASLITGATGSDTSSVIVPRGTIDRLEISTLDGNDSITLQSLPSPLDGGLDIDGSTGTDSISINAPLDTGVAGTLALTAESITQSIGISVGGVTTLDAGSGFITLNNVINDFNEVNANGEFVDLADATNIELGQITATGNLTINTDGDILDTDSSEITVGGSSTFTASGNILINREERHNFSGTVSLSAVRIPEFASVGNISLGDITASGANNLKNQIQSGSGIVTFTGTVSIAGTSDLQVRLRGDVQQSGGSITADQLTITSIGGDVDANLPGVNDVRAFSTDRNANVQLGDITFNDINNVELTGVLANEFTLTAGGDVVNAGALRLRAVSSITTPGNYTISNTLDLSEKLTADVGGSVTIGNGVTLLIGAFDLATTNTFTVIENTSLAPITGTFNNLAEGSVLTTTNDDFFISYLGGDGNDITLSPGPSSDIDNDGLSLILERALGTDPNTASFGNTRLPVIGHGEGGEVTFTFGRGSEFLAGTRLIVERSTTLEAESFEVVYLYVFDLGGLIVLNSGISADVQAEKFVITEQSNFEKAFYRLRTILAE